jgi:flagellar biosynthesis/type III secretory pathway ATPase
MADAERNSNIASLLERHARRVEQLPAPPVEGVLTRMVGLTLEAAGCQAAVGDRCDVLGNDGARIEAEVVGFSGDRLYLMPTGDIHGLKPNARVVPRTGAETVAVGQGLLGRIIDGAGTPLDGLGQIACEQRIRLTGMPMNPLSRQPIEEPLDVGVRAINSLLTVGRGQRIGLFAGSGVGKSVLLGMMARYTSADVIVVGLIGLAIGEAPATKGYPPSVFARLPQLVERAGNGATGSGSITAFYTVLTEGDDQQDPIADAARAILDGHVVLSRRIAEAGHYPAIDIEASISRVMHDVVAPEQFALARRFKQALSTYQQNRDLIAIGAYHKGSDPRIDAAIALWPNMQNFLQQDLAERVDYNRGLVELGAIIGGAA